LRALAHHVRFVHWVARVRTFLAYHLNHTVFNLFINLY